MVELAQALEVLPNSLHKAIRSDRLHPSQKESSRCQRDRPGGQHQERTKGKRSAASMGYATTRTDERVAAAMGLLASAPARFQSACDVPQGGVLLALPALLSVGAAAPYLGAV